MRIRSQSTDRDFPSNDVIAYHKRRGLFEMMKTIEHLVPIEFHKQIVPIDHPYEPTEFNMELHVFNAATIKTLTILIQRGHVKEALDIINGSEL